MIDPELYEYKESCNDCRNCGTRLLIWPDTIYEDSPPEGVNWETNEFCPNCHIDQNG